MKHSYCENEPNVVWNAFAARWRWLF